jgi:hypothetical protein
MTAIVSIMINPITPGSDAIRAIRAFWETTPLSTICTDRTGCVETMAG